jgi:hypothetical protein
VGFDFEDSAPSVRKESFTALKTALPGKKSPLFYLFRHQILFFAGRISFPGGGFGENDQHSRVFCITILQKRNNFCVRIGGAAPYARHV